MSPRPKITVRLDRLVLNSWGPKMSGPPPLPGFEVVFDWFVRPQTNIPTYARCRMYQSAADDTKIFWQYQRRRAWLRPWKVTLVADDNAGLKAADIHMVLNRCRFWRFLLVELAVDFCPSTVDWDFVRRHGIFGKSRRRR